MKTQGPPPEDQDKDEASAEKPMAKFKRAASVIMTTSGSKVKALEALDARRRRKAAAKRVED